MDSMIFNCRFFSWPSSNCFPIYSLSKHLGIVIFKFCHFFAFLGLEFSSTEDFSLITHCLVSESCPALCDPMDNSTPVFPVLHHLPEFTQIYVYWVGDTERLLLNDKTLGFLASGGDKFNPGPEMRLYLSELLCNKVLLKYNGDRESFWHRHQKGAERVPLSQSLAVSYLVTHSLLMKRKECLRI